jgi:hypothetical protein
LTWTFRIGEVQDLPEAYVFRYLVSSETMDGRGHAGVCRAGAIARRGRRKTQYQLAGHR